MRLNKEHFSSIVRHGSFADLTVCITDFCKVSKYQKISLLAIGMLRDIIPTMLECPDCGFKETNHSATDDPMIKYWFPVLFGFYDVIMNGEDLEVRRLYVAVFYIRRFPKLTIHVVRWTLSSVLSRSTGRRTQWSSGTPSARSCCSPCSRCSSRAKIYRALARKKT